MFGPCRETSKKESFLLETISIMNSVLHAIRTNRCNYSHTQLFELLWPLVAHDKLICKKKRSTLRPYSQKDIYTAIKAYEEGTLETTKICFKSSNKYFSQTVSHIGIVANKNGYVSVLPFDFDNKQKTIERRQEIEETLELLIKHINAKPIVFNSAGGYGLHAFFILDRAYAIEEIDRWKNTLPFKTKNGNIELKINCGIFLPYKQNGECDKYISGLNDYSKAQLIIPPIKYNDLHAIRTNISSNYSLTQAVEEQKRKSKWVIYKVSDGTRKACWEKWCQEYHYKNYTLEQSLIETDKRMADSKYHDLENPSKDWSKNKTKCLKDMKDFYLNLKTKIDNGDYVINKKSIKTYKKEAHVIANEWISPLVKVYECNTPLNSRQKQWALKNSKKLLGNKYYDKNGYVYEITKDDIDNLIKKVLPAINGIYNLGYKICSIPHQAWAKLGNPVFIKSMLVDLCLIRTAKEYKKGAYCNGYKINKIPQIEKKEQQHGRETDIHSRRLLHEVLQEETDSSSVHTYNKHIEAEQLRVKWSDDEFKWCTDIPSNSMGQGIIRHT